MRLVLLLAILPAAALCEEQIQRVKPGDRSPVDGWVYPLQTHARIAADMAAIDVLIPEMEREANDARDLLDITEIELERALEGEADLSAQLLVAHLNADAQARRAAAQGRRSALLWSVLAGVVVLAPLTAAEFSDVDAPTALGAAALGLAATASLAWLLGG